MFYTNFIKIVKQYVNILDILSVPTFDQDFDVLRNRLLKTKKQEYNHRDYYVIEHYDPQYYLPHCPYSLTTFNLVRTFQEVDISLGRTMIFTNNLGYINEFKVLIPEDLHQFGLPVMFDKYLANMPFNHIKSQDCKDYQDIPINNTKIEKNCLTMIGKDRVHRNVLYTHIKTNDYLNQIATVYNGGDRTPFYKGPL